MSEVYSSGFSQVPGKVQLRVFNEMGGRLNKMQLDLCWTNRTEMVCRLLYYEKKSLKIVVQKFGYVNYIVLLCILKCRKMEIVDKFIEQHEKKVLEMFKRQKGITPFVTFFCKTQDEKGEVMVLEIPEVLMFDGGKDFVRDVLIEKIKEDLKKKNKNLVCVNFNSESWMYKGSKDDDINDYRKLPKTEILLMTFDSEEGSRQITYEIKRNMYVGEDGLGEEVDVELYKMGDDITMSGRFSNLF